MKAARLITGAKHQDGGSSHAPGSGGSPDLGSTDPEHDPELECRRGGSHKRGAVTKRVGAGVVCLGVIAAVGIELWRERIPSTDQARIERDCCPISSRINGTIGKIYVSNGQYVRAGDLLVEMDKRELEATLAAAAAEVVQDQTTMQASATRLSKEQPGLEKAVSTMRHRERELDTAMLDYQAILGVRARKGVSPAHLSMARKAYEEALSLYSQAKSVLAAAIERVQSDQDLRETMAAKLQTAQATIQQAERQLSYARIHAPVNGRVVFDKSKLAQPLRAGEVFLNLLGEPCVVASFNRNQLNHLKPGQRVRIQVGSIPKHTFRGKVAGVASPARRDIAGQRLAAALFHARPTVPVKIAFDADSLLGFEDRMDPGTKSSVEIATE
ncbi:MAG: HlyD family secretion protein [Verrucomicrobia bacterium]|nr:HlyD family secretion protein [Verrucomicrobiota bacterium]